MDRRAFSQWLAATPLMAAPLLASPLSALAQSADGFPARPIKMVVPFPAGGSTDVIGRMAAEEMGKLLKQAIVIDNRGGAGGAIGSDQVARAAADGYTLLVSGIGSNAIIHGFQSPKPSYQETDFVHISQLAAGPNVLVVHPSFPVKSFAEFIAWVKANPGKFSYGQVTSSSGHLTTEYLKQVAGLNMVGIPYKGGGPALQDVLANQIPGMFTNQDVVLPHVKAGTLRALAVTSLERNPLYPDVPTVAESGYPGFSAVSWFGISAPKATPAAVVQKLQKAAQDAVNQPAARAKLESTGFVVVASDTAAFTRFVADEGARWRQVIETAGIKPE